MSGLLLPGSLPGRVPTLTAEDVVLADGQRLRCYEHWSSPAPESQVGYTYIGPHRLSVIATIDPTPRWGPLLHVSLALPTRLPSWDLVTQVKDAFFGDVDAMMVLPKKADYVNHHNFCFHLWATPEGWGLR